MQRIGRKGGNDPGSDRKNLAGETAHRSQEGGKQHNADDDEIKDADWKLTHMIFTLVVDPGTLCR
jgi:hypothetical protein